LLLPNILPVLFSRSFIAFSSSLVNASGKT
jgi:hypothetical protein